MYELLGMQEHHAGHRRNIAHEFAGNDPELDPDRPADPPTKAIDKPVHRSGKREGTDAPRPAREGLGNQTRTRPTGNSNENGTSTNRHIGTGAIGNRL